jgi:hypothetical protein
MENFYFKKYTFDNIELYNILSKNDLNQYIELGYFNSKYCVDVMWYDDIPIEWSDYEVQPEGNGIHTFFGWQYKNKD